MKCVTVLLLSLGFPASCLATTPMPNAIPCGTLDRVSAAAGSPSLSAIALDLLERVATGRRAGISVESEKQVGLTPGEFQHPMYSDPTVRACALRSLGKTGLPGAAEFLTNFKRTDAGDDSSQEIWSAAQIALCEALMSRIADPQAKIEFLRNTLTSKTAATPRWWVVEELCNRGAAVALPDIRASIKKRLSGSDAQSEIEFCEARVQVLGRDPDRARALGSVFGSVVSLENTLEGQKLLHWAMQQLIPMRSPDADAELDRIADRLDVLAKGAPGDVQLSILKSKVNGIRSERAKK